MKKTIRNIIGAAMLLTAFSVSSLLSADGVAAKAFPIVRGVKAAKKIKGKMSAKEAQEEISRKLAERYPAEMAAIEKDRTDNSEAAKKKTDELIKKYRDETGVDLNKEFPAATEKAKEGLIRSRVEKRLDELKS